MFSDKKKRRVSDTNRKGNFHESFELFQVIPFSVSVKSSLKTRFYGENGKEDNIQKHQRKESYVIQHRNFDGAVFVADEAKVFSSCYLYVYMNKTEFFYRKKFIEFQNFDRKCSAALIQIMSDSLMDIDLESQNKLMAQMGLPSEFSTKRISRRKKKAKQKGQVHDDGVDATRHAKHDDMKRDVITKKAV